MPIDRAIRFASIQHLPKEIALVEFALLDEKGNRLSNWAVKVRSQPSADATIERARRAVLEDLKVIVRLSDAD